MTILTLAVAPLVWIAVETQAQEQPLGQNREKASFILKQVAEIYANAESIHLEAVEEQNHSSPLASGWQKVYLYLNRESFTKFRIEAHTSWGSYVQVSDGTTEWIHSVNDDQYVERPLSRDGPSFMPSAVGGLSYLRTAWTLPIWLEMLVANHKNGTLLPDETLQFAGEEIECNVIKLGVGAQSDNMDRTIWVDKRHRTIRKIRERQTQEVRNAYGPKTSQTEDTTTTFPIVDIQPQSPFRFVPGVSAQKVPYLGIPVDDSLLPKPKSPLMGKEPPLTVLGAVNGNTVSLASYRGKPVLLEFWATWCWPCMVAMPELGELYKAAMQRGLTVFTIDENEEANRQDAVEFLRRHRFTWQNLHDNGTIARSFSENGIPLTVLIDQKGNVVFHQVGIHMQELRVAIAGLGTSFADLAK